MEIKKAYVLTLAKHQIILQQQIPHMKLLTEIIHNFTGIIYHSGYTKNVKD